MDRYLEFDGSQNYGLIPNGLGGWPQHYNLYRFNDVISPCFAGGSVATTIEFWIKTTSVKTSAIVLKNAQYSGYDMSSGFEISMNEGSLFFSAVSEDTNRPFHDPEIETFSGLPIGSVNDGEWHHVAVVIDLAGYFRTFLDGVRDVNLNTNDYGGYLRLDWPLFIAHTTEGAQFNGDFSIAELRISRCVRYAEDFDGDLPTEFTVDCNTRAYYKFTEQGGTIAYDQTANGYDMALIGNPLPDRPWESSSASSVSSSSFSSSSNAQTHSSASSRSSASGSSGSSSSSSSSSSTRVSVTSSSSSTKASLSSSSSSTRVSVTSSSSGHLGLFSRIRRGIFGR
jgi:hypothetical protein